MPCKMGVSAPIQFGTSVARRTYVHGRPLLRPARPSHHGDPRRVLPPRAPTSPSSALVTPRSARRAEARHPPAVGRAPSPSARTPLIPRAPSQTKIPRSHPASTLADQDPPIASRERPRRPRSPIPFHEHPRRPRSADPVPRASSQNKTGRSQSTSVLAEQNGPIPFHERPRRTRSPDPIPRAPSQNEISPRRTKSPDPAPRALPQRKTGARLPASARSLSPQPILTSPRA